MGMILFTVMIIYVISIENDSLSRQAEELSTLTFKEQDQLTDITGYLDGIDEIVLSNKEQLSEVGLMHTGTEKTLIDFSELLASLEENMTVIETGLETFREVSGSENSSVTTTLTALTESQLEIREQITGTTETISDILSELRLEDASHFSETSNKLEGLKTDLADMKKKTKSYYQNLVELIELFQVENHMEHVELTETLGGVAEEMKLLIHERFAAMELQTGQEYAVLIEQMDSLHIQIMSAEQSIGTLLAVVGEQDENRQEEIRESFAAVCSLLDQITGDFNVAHTKLQNLITAFKEGEAANHEETLAALTTMESKMTVEAGQNLNKITDSLVAVQHNFDASIDRIQNEISNNFTGLQESESSYFDQTISALTVMETNMADGSSHNLNQITNTMQELQNSFDTSLNTFRDEVFQEFTSLNTGIENQFSEYDSSVSDRFDQIDNSISSQFNQMTTTIHDYDTGQQASYDSLLSEIKEELQTVFQSVSDGKSSLASALLTKGVTVKEDATFHEIQQGILSIPQQLVIGVEQIPGIIIYEYHHHSGDMANGGGCFTDPVYHVHTGECYNIGTCTVRTSGCFNCHNSRESYGDERFQIGTVRVSHANCGQGTYDTGSGLHKQSEHTGSSTSTHTYYTTLKCGKISGQTVDSWIRNCGLAEGQIIGANISYVKSIRTASTLKETILPDVSEVTSTEFIDEADADTISYEAGEREGIEDTDQTEDETKVKDTEQEKIQSEDDEHVGDIEQTENANQTKLPEPVTGESENQATPSVSDNNLRN